MQIEITLFGPINGTRAVVSLVARKKFPPLPGCSRAISHLELLTGGGVCPAEEVIQR